MRSSRKCSRLLVLTSLLLTLPAGAVDRGPGQDAPSTSHAPPLHARTNYAWTHETGPFYGRLDAATEREPGTIRTAVGSFDLTVGLSQLPGVLKTQRDPETQPPGYFVVAFRGDGFERGRLESFEQSLSDAGGSVIGPIPNMALLVKLTPASWAVVKENFDVLAVEPFHPALKLSPMIGRTPLPDPDRAVSPVYVLELLPFPGEDLLQLEKAIADLGGGLVRRFPDRLRVEIHRDRLADLAHLEAVRAIFEYVPPLLWGEEISSTIQTGPFMSGITPYRDAGIDGSGGGSGTEQLLMVLDNGIQLDAGDLSDTSTSAGTPPLHRKVEYYGTTGPFAGVGDLLGCDADLSDGYTHGHLVSALALGNATDVEPPYGPGWGKLGNRALDGVAPGARLIAYDAQLTPAVGSCADPLLATLSPGDLYTPLFSGSLYDGFNRGARTFNLSWGSPQTVYDITANDLDDFLSDWPEAMAFVAAGNLGQGGISSPGTAKNSVTIGASLTNDPIGNEEKRWPASAIGPSPGNRIAPLLMAPGADEGGAEADATISCRSTDNDSDNQVQCELNQGRAGTSYATGAASGAAMVVRDYFAQGYYPKGIQDASNEYPEVSGALVKAALVASADFMDEIGPPEVPTTTLTLPYRFNNEQGYGRIALHHVLPLSSWSSWTPAGLLAHDTAVPGGPMDFAGLPSVIDATQSQTYSTTFDICNNAEELRVALAWVENAGSFLVNDVDLELESPGGVIYLGNYFTDDNDRDGSINPGSEDCPSIGTGAPGVLDAGPWSLPACPSSTTDIDNLTEAIFLSPDADGNGDSAAPFNQVEPGTWTVRISTQGGGTDSALSYAMVVAGGICDSSVSIDKERPCCNDSICLTVTETDDPSDPAGALHAIEIDDRTTIRVLDPETFALIDEELSSGFTQPDPGLLIYRNCLHLTESTAPFPYNNLIEVTHGAIVEVIYADEMNGIPDPQLERRATSQVDCKAALRFGGAVFERYGRDGAVSIAGGCERNLRGEAIREYPDSFMDAGELITYRVIFESAEAVDLHDVLVSLRAVDVDPDSPPDCLPGSDDCADPDRLNNPRSSYLTVLDSPKQIGSLPAGSKGSAEFTVQMAETISGMPKVEMLVLVSAPDSGKTMKTVLVKRHKLDADEDVLFYSTDFPFGGTEIFDFNNNEEEDNPLDDPFDPDMDYRFETMTWSDATLGTDQSGASVPVNQDLLSPWHLDRNDGNFRSGLNTESDEFAITDTIAQWGEDYNCNDFLEGYCLLDPSKACYRFPTDLRCPLGNPTCVAVEDRDPPDGVLSQNWSIDGGCGWQTVPPYLCSSDPGRGCVIDLDCNGYCYSTLNPPVSTFDPCGFAQPTCPNTSQCSPGSDNQYEPCQTPGDCPNGTCQQIPQICRDDAGSCLIGVPATTGGVWHTGRIGFTPQATCLGIGNQPAECQQYETISSTDGRLQWWELLKTPVIEKVNRVLDSDGEPEFRVEVINFAWNLLLDLPDEFATLTWEVDNDVDDDFRVDLLNDEEVLGRIQGPFGAFSGGDFTPLGGYPMFAPVDSFGNSINGALGGDRAGQNACNFAFPGVGDSPFVLAGPPDDDQNNDSDGSVDEFVTDAGPIRNMDITKAGGPDLRHELLEDRIGDAGERFQAALGFLVEEGTLQKIPVPGFGASVDDVVFRWKEIGCTDDSFDCIVDGRCATVSVDSATIYESEGTVTITVVDDSPDFPQDCDGSGHINPGDDDDCNNNGLRDVKATVISAAEPDGELLILDEAVPGSNVYSFELPISVEHDVPGVLFLTSDGTRQAEITAVYEDVDDGTGARCLNSIDPSQEGFVTARSTIELPAELLLVRTHSIVDNGDGDMWADTNETVDLSIEVINLSGRELTGVTAELFTNDPKIDCIFVNEITLGTLPAGGTVVGGAFVFRVANVSRAAVQEDFSVDFSVTLAGDGFSMADRPQILSLDLDLDIVDVGPVVSFLESFEGASLTLSRLAAMPLDVGLNSNALSADYHCQYSDPGSPMSNSPGEPFCYLGFANPADNAFDWAISGPLLPHGGRAADGTHSLYWGVDLGLGQFTTRLSQMDAVVTEDPVHLSAANASELRYKQQVSLADSRLFDIPDGETLDRAVVQIQVVDEFGSPVRDWETIEPYYSPYDSQGTQVDPRCMFDPIDDGSTVTDRFTMVDPFDRLGPSSTCYSEDVFAHQGDTVSFGPERVGRSLPGDGIPGSSGIGTWVEPRFDLARYKGQSVLIRFLATSAKSGDLVTHVDRGVDPDDPADDGWYIDDIQITNTLTQPATAEVDIKDLSLPVCGLPCNDVAAILDTDPLTLWAPGQKLTVTAEATTANLCSSGVLLYEFWVDGNANGVLGEAADELLRPYAPGAKVVHTPVADTSYGVRVYCSSDPSCNEEAFTSVTVERGSCIDPPSDLVAWWPFSEPAGPSTADVAVVVDGVANDGTLVGGVSRSEGYVGTGLLFPGDAGSYVSINPDFDLNASGFTLDAWVRPDYFAGPLGEYTILEKGTNGAGEWHFGVDPVTGQLQLELDCGLYAFPEPLPCDQWSHVAVTVDASDVTLYVNGSSFTFPSCVYDVTNAQPMRIGPRFLGDIDEVEVFDRALTILEIAGLVEAGRAGKCPEGGLCVDPPHGMISWYPADACDAEDLLGPNDGTAVGSPTCPIDPKVAPGGLDFSSAHFEVPHHPTLDFGSDEFSIDLWIRTTGEGTILEKGFLSGAGWQLAVNGSGHLTFNACESTLSGPICVGPLVSTATVDNGSWRHVALTASRFGGISSAGRRDTTFTLYVDGAVDATERIRIGATDSQQDMLIGTSTADPAFGGSMDEIELFDRTLTAAEVSAIFAADDAGKCRKTFETRLGGVVDDYASPVDSSSPSAGLDAYTDADTREFDDDAVDAFLLHTFDLAGMECIATASLEFQARPVPSSGSENDALNLLFADPTGTDLIPGTPVYGRRLGPDGGDLGLQPLTWDSSTITGNYGPSGYTFILPDLRNLTTASGSLLNAVESMETLGHLDLRVHDDTEVDYLELVVQECPCPCAPPPAGMVSWYPADACTPEDVLGSNDGVYTGSSTCPPAPKVGTGALGNFGTGNFITVADHPSLAFGRAGFSYDLWIRTSQTDVPILQKGDAVNGPGYRLSIVGGLLELAVCDDTSVCTQLSGIRRVDSGDWRHVAMTVSAAPEQLALYVDGYLEVSASFGAAASTDSPDDLLIGTAGPDFFDGAMDEIEIFRRELTPEEVRTVAGANSTGKCRFGEVCVFGGEDDYYALPVDLAEPSPGSILQGPASLRNFDEGGSNEQLRHTFDLSAVPGCIVGASLTGRARPDSEISTNDTISLRFIDPDGNDIVGRATAGRKWGPDAGDPGLQPEDWEQSTITSVYGSLGYTFDFPDLRYFETSTGDFVDFVSDMDELRFLDMVVQDDTEMDFVKLTVIYDESCDPGPIELLLEKNPGSCLLRWSPAPDVIGYDVVRGDLGQLRAANGDFGLASPICQANDLASTLNSTTDTPGAGQGYFYLVRGVGAASVGTWDSGGPAQVGFRDELLPVPPPPGGCP